VAGKTAKIALQICLMENLALMGLDLMDIQDAVMDGLPLLVQIRNELYLPILSLR